MDFYNSLELGLCSYCNNRTAKEKSITCNECKAFVYCCVKCKDLHWENKENPDHAHKNWCYEIKKFMNKEKDLQSFPFDFATETTSRSFDMVELSDFLMKHGLLGKGMWRRECQLWKSTAGNFHDLEPDPLPGDFLNLTEEEEVDLSREVILPSESVILSLPPLAVDAVDTDRDLVTDPLVDWRDYYTWRGLRLSSPVAVLMQWPLTIYHIVVDLLPRRYPNLLKSILKEKSLSIHVVGAEKEVDLLPTFQELKYLLPGLQINLTLIGRDISPRVHNITRKQGLLRYHIIRGVYHNLDADVELSEPHLIIGFNAGLAAYITWPESLMRIKNASVPSFFTDFCQYSASCGHILAQRLGLGPGDIHQVEVNPFRGPLRVLSDQNHLPWFSNAFIFSPLYSPPDRAPVQTEEDEEATL